MEPVTFWFIGQYSNQLSYTGQSRTRFPIDFFEKIVSSVLLLKIIYLFLNMDLIIEHE